MGSSKNQKLLLPGVVHFDAEAKAMINSKTYVSVVKARHSQAREGRALERNAFLLMLSSFHADNKLPS